MSDLKKYLSNKINNDEAVSNFINWFGESKVVDEYGLPKTVYHGTLSDFSVFDLRKTNPESHYGQGFYTSDKIDDVNANYGAETGPDLKAKIAQLEDLLDNYADDYIRDYDLPEDYFESPENREAFAKKRMADMIDINNEGFIMPLYLKMEKPMVIEEATFDNTISFGNIDPLLQKLKEHDVYSAIAYEVEGFIDQQVGGIGEETTIHIDELIEFINDNYEYSDLDRQQKNNLIKVCKNFFRKHDDVVEVTVKFDGEMDKFKEAVLKYMDETEMRSSSNFEQVLAEEFPFESQEVSVKDILENDALQMLFCDEYIGEHNSVFDTNSVTWKAVFSNAIRKMGYDGIIMNAEEHFQNMKNIEDTTHYIVFESNQIKSAIGNNGDYALDEPNILHRINNHYVEKNKVTKEDALSMLTKLKEVYPFIEKVNLYEKKDDMPPYVAAECGDGTTGMFSSVDKRTHLFLFNMKNQSELYKTIVHEIFGHMSMRTLLKDNYYSAMNKIYDYYDKKGELEEVKKNYVELYKLDLNKTSHKAVLAEEKMAFVIENRGFDKFPLKNVIIGAIRNQIRKVVPELEVNKDDIEYLIHSCHKVAKKGLNNNFHYKKHNKLNI